MTNGILRVMVANAINLCIGLVNSFFLPRYLPVETYAMIKTYTLYLSYAGFFHLGYLDGMYLKYGGKAMDKVPPGEYGADFNNVLLMQGVVGVLVAVVAGVLQDKIMLAFAFGMFLNNMITCHQMFFQAVGEFGLYSKALNIKPFIALVGSLILLLLLRCETYLPYIICQLLSAVVPFLYITAILQSNLPFLGKGGLSWKGYRDNIASGFVLMLGNFSNNILTGIDRWFIKLLMTTTDFAIYSFAVSVDSLVAIFVNPVTITMYHTLCTIKESDKIREMKRMILLWGCVIMALAFPAKWVIEHFLDKYLHAVELIFLLFATQAFYAVIKGIYVNLFKARKQQQTYFRQMILIELASGLYLFTVSGGHAFSRIILYLMGIFYVLLSYCTRIIWKKRLLHKMAEGGEHSLYIVTNYDLASKVIQNVKEHNYNRYNINGLILIDKDMTGKEIAGVPVVADLNNASSFICQQWVDEVFVNVDETYPYPQELIEELLEMGMPVHVNLAKVRSTPGQKQFVEAIGGYTVLTTTMNYATDRQALAKRVLDILGGLVGCFLTGIIFIFIAPAIYISSPGPIFFSQTRIGKNGKPFKMYKFRSMYMDAEERKAELMAQNKMSDGRMFKLDFDPRVIGNKILPDGTKKTGIGEFIRKTSLDEFPQFWNVLNGSMSLVGTRPILQDELRQYELHHRARIAIKPGITGMWQVSGRSDITDFEEVVRLDTEYISNWSFSLDIKILFKTVIMVLKREGSV